MHFHLQSLLLCWAALSPFLLGWLTNAQLCDKFEVEKMEQYDYKPLSFGENVKVDGSGVIKIANKEIKDAKYEGIFTKVLIGYLPGEKGEEEGKCVAVKMYIFDVKTRRLFENVVKVERKIGEPREHIVKTLALGEIDKLNAGFVAMELGGKNFDEGFLWEKANLDGDRFRQIIRQLVIPLREFHNVAVHLDVKPQNYVYFPVEGNEESRLKLIDFDGALLLSESAGAQQHINKLISVDVKQQLHTITYVAPEFEYKSMVSTKADLWSVGIIVHEIALAHFQIYRRKLSDQYPHILIPIDGKTQKLLSEFSKTRTLLFADMERKDGRLKKEELENLLDKPKYLKFLLQFRRAFPREFLLMQNLLNLKSVDRMSAKGVVDFLDENCAPPLHKDGTNPPAFFHTLTPAGEQLTAAGLKELLENKTGCTMKRCLFWKKNPYADMLTTLEEGNDATQNMETALEALETKCDV